MITGGVGQDNDDDRDCVCRVQADDIGGHDGDHVPANERWGHVPFTVTAAGQVYTQTVEFEYSGGAISGD